MGLLSRVFAPESKPVSAKVVRNTLFSALENMLVFPIPFLLIPFILKKIGVADYGVYAVLLSVIGFTTLTDVGMFATLTKHVAEYYAKGDFATLKRMLNTGLMFYLLVSFILMGGLWAATDHLLPALFRGMSTPYPELRTLWRLTVMTMGLNLLSAPFSSIVFGLQRMDLSSALGFANIVSNAIFTVAFLIMGWGLRGVLYAGLASGLLNLGLVAGSARKLLPQVSLNPFRFGRGEMKEIFSFSWQIYTIQLGSVVQSQIEKIYLAWLVGVTPVAWFSIASTAGQKARRVPDLLLTPITAASSELDAGGREGELKELYYRSHKYIAFFGVPLVALSAVLCRPFVKLWVGSQLDVIAIPLALLVLTNVVSVVTGPGTLISIGRGKLAPSVYSVLITTVLNLVLSFFLIRVYGFTGAVFGTLASVCMGVTLFMYLFHRYTGYRYPRLLTESYLKPLGASLVGAGVCFLTGYLGPPGWVRLALQAVAFGFAYLMGLLLARFFDQFDLRQAARLVPVLRRMVGMPSVD